jgi:GDPmannose 4,6-dehydratase
MWMILQAEEPEDWVIATGKTTRVRDFVQMAFAEAGIELSFSGSGVKEKACVKFCNNPDYQLPVGKEVLSIDPGILGPQKLNY